MKKRFLLLLVALMLFSQCGKPAATGAGQHDAEDEFKIQLTAYSEKFELFAEADPLVKGKECSLLVHFTHLADFKPLPDGKVVLSLAVAGRTARAEQAAPLRPGIYRFTLVPGAAGKGRLAVTIAATAVIAIDDLEVYETPEAARQAMAQTTANA